MDENDKMINDIQNLIKFYEGLGESNSQLKVYVNRLHEELDKLIQEKNNKDE
jgi:hypothetical protein